MKKVFSSLILLVLVLCMAGNALADVDWDNDNGIGDRRWDNPLNWDPNNVPTDTDDAKIRNIGDGPIIDLSTTAVAGWLVCGNWGQTNTLDITGGSLTTNGDITLGYDANDEGTLNVSDGGTAVIGSNNSVRDLIIGQAGTGHVNISDGSITVSDDMRLGLNDSGTGTLTISDGDIDVGKKLFVGKYGTGTITMTGGSITAGYYAKFGEQVGSTGNVTMEDGTITIKDDAWFGGEGTSTITMSGGAITVGDGSEDNLTVGGGGTGHITMSDGTISVKGFLSFGESGTGSLTMTGGTITVTATLYLAYSGSANISLNGGTISCGVLDMRNDAAISITKDGTLMIAGDVRELINTYIDAGRITAYGDPGYVKVDYNTANPGMTTVSSESTVVPIYIYPERGEAATVGDVELSWTNIDPNFPGDPVYVDAWFGTEPNHPSANYTKVVTAGEDVNSVLIPYPGQGTYYWQVNSYINGASHINEPNIIRGPITWFNFDSTPTVDAGVDMVTWSNEPVALDATVDDDGSSPMTILWTAEPNNIVTFEPNEFVEDPTVKIIRGSYTKAYIVNPSFENEMDGWDGPGWTWDGTYNGIQYVTPTDGSLCAYTWSDSDAALVLSQTLTETLAADTTYTLTVDVVNNGYYGEDVEYKVQLLAGETVVAEDDDGHLLLAYGIWETSTVVHTSGGASDPNIGEPLEIHLVAKEGTKEMCFDNVELIADPGFPVLAGGTYTLTVTATDAIGSDSDTMTIDVYDDQCQAARVGFDLAEENPGDINADCDTDLADLAEMAEKWLDNAGLKEPAVLMAPTYGTDAFLKVDFNSDQDGGGDSTTADDPGFSVANHHQPGWSSYHANHEEAAEFTTANYGGITVTPDWPNTTAASVRQSIDRGSSYDASWDNAAGDINLVTDWIGIDSRTGNGGNGDWDGTTGTPTYMTLAIGSLSAGYYDWISFHHDTENIHGPFAVWLSTDGGSTYTQLADGVMSVGTGTGTPETDELESGPDAYTLPSTYKISFTANGTDDVVMRFAPYAAIGTSRQLWGMNGLVISAGPNAPEADAGLDWITLSGESVTLAATVDMTGSDWTSLTYVWSAYPDTGVVIDDADTLAPIVTITKTTLNPSVVALTLAVYGDGNSVPVRDTMMIDVYDDACLAARAAGTVTDETDLDGNCTTGLGDFAVLAKTWLDDNYELTEPVEKP